MNRVRRIKAQSVVADSGFEVLFPITEGLQGDTSIYGTLLAEARKLLLDRPIKGRGLTITSQHIEERTDYMGTYNMFGRLIVLIHFTFAIP